MKSSSLNFMDRTFGPSVVFLGIIFTFFEITDVDLWAQDQLYHFASHSWFVNARDPVPRLIYYIGPKFIIWLFGLCMLILSFAPSRWRDHLRLSHFQRWDLWILVGTLAIAPLSVATLKAATNVHTPSEIRRYGGFAPYVKVCEAYPLGDRPVKRGRGFPAGHASGGFALLALAGLARSNHGRWIGISIGLGAGIWMGGYQMLKGAHYMSHTIITALICWTVFLLLRRIQRAYARPQT